MDLSIGIRGAATTTRIGRSLVVVVTSLLLHVLAAESHHHVECGVCSDAISALQSDANVTVNRWTDIGIGFLGATGVLPAYLGGPNVTRGVVVMPEEGVAPEAYAPLARELALSGSYVVILEKACEGRTLRAMKTKPHLQYWLFAGHGRGGGALAAELALTLHPKVKGLILMAAPMPLDVDMADLNMIVVVLYGQKDDVVTPAAVEESFSRMPGDTAVTLFPNLGHFDFACCVRNGTGRQGIRSMDQDFDTIVLKIYSAVVLSSWAVASEKALSFSDNQRLTPGLNISKVYPGDIRVQCTQVPIPNSSPQRLWWVFTPTKIKGGLVYYPGAAVDARAYFPLAFEIAARGHLVVIVQMPFRNAALGYQDANTVIASNHSLFSGVPKDKWALGGHSAGGYASTIYAGEFGDRIYAVVMHAGGWGANLTGNPLPVANIYGTLDDLSPGGYDRYRYSNVDPPPRGRGPLVNLETSRFVHIEGANHYQVGDYGYQSPDEIPTISMEEQVSKFATETVLFLQDVASGKIFQTSTHQSETSTLKVLPGASNKKWEQGPLVLFKNHIRVGSSVSAYRMLELGHEPGHGD